MPIEVRDVCLTYGEGTPFETRALRNVSFTIEDGEFVGVMGHTGCGKSTMLQLIDGLIKPTEGTVLLDGEDINAKGYDRTKLRNAVGYVFQYPECQLFETTVEKDVAFGLKHSRLSKEEVAEQVKWALEAVGFDYEKVRKKSPLGFSGGEKRRIAIAGILATKPRYLLLDEPIAGLDPLGREAFMRLLKTLNEQGTTIIMVSHNADSIGECTRRVLVFDHGELVENGGTSEVFSDVEKMRSRHIGVSQSREIAHLLKEKGIDITGKISRYEELKDAVFKILKGGEQL